MVYGVVIILLLMLIALSMISGNDSLRQDEKRMLQVLYFWHLLMGFVYFTYAQFNRSDSVLYYKRPLTDFRGPDWFDSFKPGTEFVEWLIWPFIKWFGFTYESSMALFCFSGFLGFYFFYLFFKERIRFKHDFYGYNLLTIIMFLPNMHFWTASLGKGSIIFCGIGIFVWSMNKFAKRLLPLAIGAFIIWGIRVPILLVLVLGAGVGFMISSRGLSASQKAVGVILALGGIIYVSQETSSFLQLDQIENVTNYFDKRGQKLSRSSGSSVDIANYNDLQKIFTFIYRPLFFDGRNALGIVVSIENVFYVILTFKLLNRRALSYLWRSDYMVKMAFVAFIGSSYALAQISGNLGIAIRQKSQVMFLFLFVVIQFLDDEKMARYVRSKRAELRAKRMQEIEKAA